MKLLKLFILVICSSAIAQAYPLQVERIAYDYTDLYEKTARSVVKIETDGGSGSGFIVDAEKGLIATNHHVVRNSRFLAVKFADRLRVEAVPLKLSSRYDLAILKIHPSFTRERDTLPLLPPEEEAKLKPGIPVVAFGSPLSQDFLVTQGIISKVQENSLLGDFLIKPGNSGGPLLNLEGYVIGVNTFGVDDIAGAVRGHILQQILEETLRENLAAAEVSSDPLQSLPSDRFPPELLKKKIMEGSFTLTDYQFGADKFTVTAVTPVSVGRSQVREELMQAVNRYKRRGRKIEDPSYSALDNTYYEWTRSISDRLDMAVIFQVMPEYGETGGSLFRGILFTGLTGLYSRKTLEFKGEFLDLKIYRDGELIEPVYPGRLLVEELRSDLLAQFMDEAYAGYYTYDPSAFMTGNIFKIEVYDAKEPDKPHAEKTFSSGSLLIRRLREDFSRTPIQHWPILPKLETNDTSNIEFTAKAAFDKEKGTIALPLNIPYTSLEFRETDNKYEERLQVVAGVFDKDGEIIGSYEGEIVLKVDDAGELTTGSAAKDFLLFLSEEGVPESAKVVVRSITNPESVGFLNLSVTE